LGLVDPTVEHDLLVLIDDANLATTEMEIDGTIFHGWLLLRALSASILVQRKLAR
jgi:hypothetical protein